MKVPLWAAVGAPIVAAAGMNGLIYWRGWGSDDRKKSDHCPRSPLLPPGLVIAGVWVLLLALLGAAWFYAGDAGGAATLARAALIVLVLYCIAYPVITGGLGTSGGAGACRRARVCNLGAMVLSVTALALLLFSRARPRAVALTLPVLFWVTWVLLTDALRA